MGRLAKGGMLCFAVASICLALSGCGSAGAKTTTTTTTGHHIDYAHQNKLAPWQTHIEEGSTQAVGIVLGQSLNPDGSVSQILINRAIKAKSLLDEGKVIALIASGSDPEGVGRTEASSIAKVLRDQGIPGNKIIQEAQATTTAENAWFSLRWLPKGTGQVYVITSDFHIARATYEFEVTFNYFYRMLENSYKNDPRWTSTTKKYPRLKLLQAVAPNFCGKDPSPSGNGINSQSLSERARNEVKWLGTGEVEEAFAGPPNNTMDAVMYIWPIQINVHEDPENKANYNKAMAQAMNAAKSLCVCLASPEDIHSPALPYPLVIPVPDTFPSGKNASDWKEMCPAPQLIV